MSEPKHPYQDYEDTPVWAVVQKALRDLKKNGDLDLKTAETYVVGYVAKALDEASFRQVLQLRRGDKPAGLAEVA